MDYQREFVIDFATRTRANLEYIEAKHTDGEAVFEVTQLANSLLGLLVFPRERYMSNIPDTPLADLVSSGWPNIKTTQGSLPHETLRQLMRMLRNCIAHCNVEFVAGPDSQITGIKVWNTVEDRKANTKYKTWEAELSLADLRAIAFKFIELIAAEGKQNA